MFISYTNALDNPPKNQMEAAMMHTLMVSYIKTSYKNALVKIAPKLDQLAKNKSINAERLKAIEEARAFIDKTL